MRHFLLFLSISFACSGQISVSLTASSRSADAQWYEAKVCHNHTVAALQISGQAIRRAISPHMQLYETYGYALPSHRRLLVLPDRNPPMKVWTDEMVIELARGVCQIGLVRAAQHADFKPFTIMIDPPYSPPLPALNKWSKGRR